MTRVELMQEVLRGRLLIVGEFRGAHAAMDGYVDKTTGEKVGYVKAIILAECQVRGNLARAMFYQRLPDSIETPEDSIISSVERRRAAAKSSAKVVPIKRVFLGFFAFLCVRMATVSNFTNPLYSCAFQSVFE